VKNLPFVLWIILYPIAMRIEDYIAIQIKIIRDLPVKLEPDAETFSILSVFVSWIIIAYLLYER
jgi:hypothetical protein